MADPRRVVVSPCPHTRRVTAEPLCDACVLAAPTATIEECEWCVWINRGLPGAPTHSLVPGAWARCNACGGTGIGRIVAAPQQSARENA